MPPTAPNRNLNTAKRRRNDEFYTQLVDVESELSHYRDHLPGKVIYCNCDNPAESNFYRYFSDNFDTLRLGGLRATCYAGGQGLAQESGGRGLWLERRADGLSLTELEGDGDFRSAECRALLEDSDIVVTNPPFSLFREYVAQLAEWGGEFLILGRLDAVKYRDVFPLLADGVMWLGVDNGGCKWFEVPPEYEIASAGRQKVEGGRKYFSHGNICWFTNLDHGKRHDALVLRGSYARTPERYPAYDDYPAIEVGRVPDIPGDYDGEMGVPITFLDRHCPEQFEIVGLCRNLMKARSGRVDSFRLGGRKLYTRIVIRRV